MKALISLVFLTFACTSLAAPLALIQMNSQNPVEKPLVLDGQTFFASESFEVKVTENGDLDVQKTISYDTLEDGTKLSAPVKLKEKGYIVRLKDWAQLQMLDHVANSETVVELGKNRDFQSQGIRLLGVDGGSLAVMGADHMLAASEAAEVSRDFYDEVVYIISGLRL